MAYFEYSSVEEKLEAELKEAEEKLKVAVEEIERLEGSLLSASSIKSQLSALLEKIKEK